MERIERQTKLFSSNANDPSEFLSEESILDEENE